MFYLVVVFNSIACLLIPHSAMNYDKDKSIAIADSDESDRMIGSVFIVSNSVRDLKFT